MKNVHRWVSGVLVGLTCSSASACNGAGGVGVQASSTGRVQMALSAATSSGMYRLRGGTFRFTGASLATASTEDDPAASTITISLTAGDYLVELDSGWSLERQQATEGASIPVAAVLTSQNPLPITVRGQETTNARFQFRAGSVVIDLGPGQVSVGIDVDDSNPADAGPLVPVADAGGSGPDCHDSLVISQIYTAGGNATATFLNDFIEIHNRGVEAANLGGWSVQYASATGATWAVTALPAIVVAPGGFVLVQEASGGSMGAALPVVDGVGTINLAASAGKVALVSTTVPLSGACPTGNSVVDFVGYGAAGCVEGHAAAGAPSSVTAIARVAGGCADTGENAIDTNLVVASPRNATTGALVCPCP